MELCQPPRAVITKPKLRVPPLSRALSLDGYHDGRYATLQEVVRHYDAFLELGLSDQEKTSLVEYLKSL
jgi:hypothetical protein